MFRNKLMALILLTAVFLSAKAYCQQEIEGPRTGTISGKVDSIDGEGGVLNVVTDNGVMTFHLSTESALFRATHYMASVEIMKDDFVTIEYSNFNNRNNVIKLVDQSVPAQ